MSRVHVLSAEVIARIAAGEVVDRPASVVKELMENSLDAGADRVDVELRGGGKDLILVRDNGSGVDRADLECLFARHATSKVRSSEDLETLTSFGFRGEALYSIAAVSDVRMRTATADSSEAWEICQKGGERVSLMPAARTGQGTELRVEDIFFNTPARKKFLRADATELDQVIHAFLPCALFYYGCSFTLTNNGRVLYDLKPAVSRADRAAAALNLDLSYILEAGEDVPGDNVRLQLVLGDINIQRPRRDLQYIFINGRPVQHKGIAFQVNDVYRLIMPQGVHPFFMIFLDVPPEDVDVNIHPQKREVRLRQESRINSILRSAVERALMTKSGARQFEPAQNPPVSLPSEQGIPSDRILFHSRQSGGFSGAREISGISRPLPEPETPRGGLFAFAQEGLKDRLARGRFIGTFMCKYHLFEEADSLFLVDQHAAQERIIFERIMSQVHSGQVEVQRLLAPLAVRLTTVEMLAWERLHGLLDQLGFETSLISRDTVAVFSYPLLLAAPENVLRQLLADEGQLKVDTESVARRACRASVMSGDRMQAVAADHQLRELLACADFMTCPHGRPVFVEMKAEALDRQFFRL